MNIIKLVGAATVAWAAVVGAPAPFATAQSCPDVQVVFARGTAEPPGLGGTGQAFVDSLRSQTGTRSVDVYPVNYAASTDFADRIGFARSVVDGVRDAAVKVESTAATCPDTKVVLGGFSQGAVLAGYVTAAEIPPGIPVEYMPFIPEPMAPEVSDHVAAVVLIGKPSEGFMRDIGAPPVVIGPSYTPKTLELCAEGDTICDGAPFGGPSVAHALYGVNGMVGEAAGYVVGRL